jgi:hypothetical protein
MTHQKTNFINALRKLPFKNKNIQYSKIVITIRDNSVFRNRDKVSKQLERNYLQY